MLLLVYDEKYWKEIVNFDALIENGVINKSDLNYLNFCNSVDEAFKCIIEHFDKHYLTTKEQSLTELRLEIK
jgi:predicted Rossmann-fold nucleotide-binding protein